MNQADGRQRFRRQMAVLLKRTDMKRVTLSKLTGANVSQINRWTDGDLMPTWNQFSRIMEIFGVEAEWLLGQSVSKNGYEKMYKPGM